MPSASITALSAGLRYAILSPDLARAVFRGFAFGLAAIAAQALAPLVASIQLGGDATIYGVLLGSFGAGAVFGGFVTVHVRARLDNEAVCKLGFALSAVANVGLGALVRQIVPLFFVELLALIVIAFFPATVIGLPRLFGF